jgi:predicted ATPase
MNLAPFRWRRPKQPHPGCRDIPGQIGASWRWPPNQNRQTQWQSATCRHVTEICRKLDGVPLAIELAAMRAAIFGLKDTAARLGSRLDLLKFGRRTANPRHRTLRATLDWSHDHLSEVERLVLRRVAIFIGSFTPDTAVAIVEEEGMSQNDVAEAIESLVDKSMVEAAVDTHETSYRLLDTTRAYALEKLRHSGETTRWRLDMRTA